MSHRRALIVGIDDYPENELYGCVNDANSLGEIVSRNYDNSINFNCEILTSDKAKITRPTLRESIEKLFRDPAEIALFHFSGHGTINGLGGYLVTTDGQAYDVGISMSELLSMANDSSVDEVFITLDCCHGGAFGGYPEIKNERVVLSEGVSVITATRQNQEALEEGSGGVFTSLLAEALEGGASGLLGEVTAASTYAYIDNALGAWDQRPMFKSNVSKFIVLSGKFR